MNDLLSIINADLSRTHPENWEPQSQPIRMEEACRQIAAEIFRKKSFTEILQLAGRLTQNIASESNILFAEQFGTLRTPGNSYHRIRYTPLNGEFSSIIDALLQIDQKDSSMNWEYYEEGQNLVGFRIGLDRNSSHIHLSRYLVYSGEKSQTGIVHTYPENLEKSLLQCDFLYNEILELQDKKEFGMVDQYRARIHWWIIQTAPFFRGNPAAGEMIAAGMTLSFCGKLIQWKEKVHPDQVALVSSEDDFVAFYSQLYELR
jgi:hypothetical protein